MSELQTLLAIDLGVRAGFALYGRDGRLIEYRSANFGSRGRMKQAAYGVLRATAGLAHVVAEGGSELGELWEKPAVKLGATFQLVHAETWREVLLLARQQRSGRDAKAHADTLARAVIQWSGAARPTSLRHDAAEAILVGLWGVLDLGWLGHNPL